MFIQNLKYICVNCGKGVQYANLVSFSKNRVHHIRKPNLHLVRVLVGGKVVRQKLCSSCLKKAVRPHKVEMAKVAAAKAAAGKTGSK